MIETLDLQNFGLAGIFIAYLIYDRQVLLKGFLREVRTSIKELTDAINNQRI